MKNIFLLVMSSFMLASSFSVQGMTCGIGCVKKIESQILSLEGVSSCDVNYELSTMIVDYDKSKLNDGKIISYLAENTTYKIELLSDQVSNPSTTCAQKACCAKKEKKNFFKSLFSWF